MPIISHTVALNLSEKSPEKISAIFELIGTIATDPQHGIYSYEYGRIDNTSAEVAANFNRDMTHVFTMLFLTQAQRDNYLPHKKHQAIGKKLKEFGIAIPGDVLPLDLRIDAVRTGDVRLITQFIKKHSLRSAFGSFEKIDNPATSLSAHKEFLVTLQDTNRLKTLAATAVTLHEPDSSSPKTDFLLQQMMSLVPTFVEEQLNIEAERPCLRGTPIAMAAGGSAAAGYDTTTTTHQKVSVGSLWAKNTPSSSQRERPYSAPVGSRR